MFEGRTSMKAALRCLFGQGFYYSEREEAWRSATNPDRTIRHRIDRGKVRWILSVDGSGHKDITEALATIVNPTTQGGANHA